MTHIIAYKSKKVKNHCGYLMKLTFLNNKVVQESIYLCSTLSFNKYIYIYLLNYYEIKISNFKCLKRGLKQDNS
jgi:hypothetical protein